MHRKGTLFCTLILVLVFINGCQIEKDNVQDIAPVDNDVIEEQFIANETDDLTITYKEENQKTILFEDLTIDLYPYHIVKKIINDKEAVFYCERNSDMTAKAYEVEKMISICRYTDEKVKTFEEAVMLFKNQGMYHEIESYQNIRDSTRITNIYTFIGDTSYYLVYTDENTYLIESDDEALILGLLEGSGSEYKAEGIYCYEVECGKEVNFNVIETIHYDSRMAKYEFYTQEGHDHFMGELFITMEDTNQYQYTFSLFDSDYNIIQILDWNGKEEKYPKFIDINLDGMVDMELVVDYAPSYDILLFYVWDSERVSYQEVEYEGTLSEIRVEDGYLLNWLPNGWNSFIIQKLVWNGNELIKESEEIVTADE